MPERCSLESVCGQACVYRHIARCVFNITIFINHSMMYFEVNGSSIHYYDVIGRVYCLVSCSLPTL